MSQRVGRVVDDDVDATELRDRPLDERPQRVFSSRESMYDWAHDNGLKPRVVKHDSPNKRHDYTCHSPIMFDVWSD